jgi:hypothetical protein
MTDTKMHSSTKAAIVCAAVVTGAAALLGALKPPAREDWHGTPLDLAAFSPPVKAPFGDEGCAWGAGLITEQAAERLAISTIEHKSEVRQGSIPIIIGGVIMGHVDQPAVVNKWCEVSFSKYPGQIYIFNQASTLQAGEEAQVRWRLGGDGRIAIESMCAVCPEATGGGASL